VAFLAKSSVFKRVKFTIPGESHDDGGAGYSHRELPVPMGVVALGSGMAWIKRHAYSFITLLATITLTASYLFHLLLSPLTLVGELEGRCRQHHTGHGPFEAMFPN